MVCEKDDKIHTTYWPFFSNICAFNTFKESLKQSLAEEDNWFNIFK